MSFITTAPQRLAWMAYDASTSVAYSSHYYHETLENVLRPGILVEEGDGEYPATAAGVERPEEVYTLNIIGRPYGSDGNRAAQDEVRQIMHDLVLYIMKRTQLQFSNQRGHPDRSAQPGLLGVEHVRVRRGQTTKMQWDGASGPFWGGVLTVNLVGYLQAIEILVANASP